MCSKEKKLTRRTFKSFIKDHPSTTYSGLLGTALINNNLVVLEGHNIIMRRDYKIMKGKVKIIGGGGAGIEPAEACYVGKGMLTAAVMGDTFSAPPANEILVAIRELAVESSDEILLLVKNYLGDKLNFGLALERAISENINVKMLLIGDNITEIISEKHGRKGLAGSVLVYKIAGEMAEQGKAMEEIIEECRENVLTDLVTVSAALAPCCSGLCDSLIHHIGPEEMVLGIGIYGQRGVKKIKINSLIESVTAVTEELYQNIKTCFELGQNSIVVLVNNLGAMTKLEEAVITKEVSNQISDKNINIARLYAGTFMSTLNTQGFSVTALKINSQDTVMYLNASTSAPAWPRCVYDSENFNVGVLPVTIQPECQHDQLNKARFEKMSFGAVISEKAVAALKQITIFAAEALISCERQLNIIDTEAGDGDAGTVLKKGAEAIKKAVLNDELDIKRPCKFLFELAEICCAAMGGISGALYYVFFSSAAITFLNTEEITLPLCCTAFKSAVKGIKHYGKAEMGDRTMLDALCPTVGTFESAVENGKDLTQTIYLVAATCEYKAEETKLLLPSYLQNTNFNLPLLYPDAGAHAVGIWLRAVTFDPDEPNEKPGIFLWKFLTEEESKYVLRDDVCSPEIMTLLERKIGTDQTLLVLLLVECIKYCRTSFEKAPKLMSALVGTVYYTHLYFIASKWRTPAETFIYFRESILCQSVEFPPKSTQIFEPDQAKNALYFFFEIYIRNLPLVRLLQLPNYKLTLKLKDDRIFLPMIKLGVVNSGKISSLFGKLD